MMTHETNSGPHAFSNAAIEKAALSDIQNIHQKSYSLVMFAHPHCVCTKASLAELAWITQHCSQQLHAVVVFVKPGGAPDDWLNSENWKLATAISGASAKIDENAQLARKFGAMTSGHAFLIDREGRALFSGGITQARGIEGENDGRRAICAIAMGSAHLDAQAKPIETSVFGCLLY